MVNELTLLYNTMMTIETKGENTKIMAQCLNYTQQLIAKCAAEEKAKTEKAKTEKVGEEGGK